MRNQTVYKHMFGFKTKKVVIQTEKNEKNIKKLKKTLDKGLNVVV